MKTESPSVSGSEIINPRTVGRPREGSVQSRLSNAETECAPQTRRLTMPIIRPAFGACQSAWNHQHAGSRSRQQADAQLGAACRSLGSFDSICELHNLELPGAYPRVNEFVMHESDEVPAPVCEI
jgi:hypothetical protein